MGLLRVGEKDALPLLAGGRLAAVPRPARPQPGGRGRPSGALDRPSSGLDARLQAPRSTPDSPIGSRSGAGISARPAARRGPADGRVLAGGRLAAVSTPREARQAAPATPSVPHIGGTPMGPEN